MTKAEILKKTGLTEEEFYKKFPTKESFEKFMASQNQMKFGGLTPEQTTGVQAAGALVSSAGEAVQQIKGPSNRPNVAAQTGGGALKGLGSGAATGASIGAGIGTLLGPGVGTAAGAGIGALVGGAAGLIGGTALGNRKGRQELGLHRTELEADRFIELGQERMDAMMGATPGINMPGYGAGQMKYGGPTNKTQVEIEGNELIQFNQGGLATVMGGPGELNQLSSGVMKADGPSHEGGGIPINTDEGRVFSDVVPKGEKQSPAQKAEEVSKELQQYEERAKKGGFAQKTYEFMKKQLEGKLDDIYNTQEALKAETGKIPTNEMRMGGELPMYPDGGMFGNEPNLMGYEAGNTLSPEMAQAAYLRQLANQRVGAPNMQFGKDASNYLNPEDVSYGDVNQFEDVELEEELGPDDIMYRNKKEKEKAIKSINSIITTQNVNNTNNTNNTENNGEGNGESSGEGSGEENTVGQYDDVIKQAQMYNLLGAMPSMGYNLAKGIFGKADTLNLDRTEAQNFKAMKDLASRTNVYNPAAELAAIQGSTGRAAYDIAGKTGGDLGSYMRARIGLAGQEGRAKGSVLGAAEQQNLQAQDLKNQRLMSILQAEMQDQQRVNMFNIGQREKELQYNKAAQAAQNQYMNAFYSQLGALGKGLGTTELYKAQLDALTKKK